MRGAAKQWGQSSVPTDGDGDDGDDVDGGDDDGHDDDSDYVDGGGDDGDDDDGDDDDGDDDEDSESCTSADKGCRHGVDLFFMCRLHRRVQSSTGRSTGSW